MKFRKKPVVIDAIQFTNYNIADVKAFCGNKINIQSYERTCGYLPSGHNILEAMVKTQKGEMLVRENDWIIKGVKGEFYACAPDVFKESYEPVEDDTCSNNNEISW